MRKMIMASSEYIVWKYDKKVFDDYGQMKAAPDAIRNIPCAK